MKQNLANRLAGGGVWAIQTAMMCIDSVRHMREEGVPNPVVNLSDRQVLISAAINAFNLFVNVNMDGYAMQAQVKVAPDAVEPKFADKYGQPITQQQWMELQGSAPYKQVDVWRNGLEFVYTVWTGLDGNGCDPPHIFATAVVRIINGEAQVQHTFKTTCLADAHKAHRQAVHYVRVGRL